jgi:hypothetical protein
MTKMVTVTRMEDWGNNGDGDGDDKDGGNNEDGGYDENADDAGREDWGNNGDRDDEDGGNNEDGCMTRMRMEQRSWTLAISIRRGFPLQ